MKKERSVLPFEASANLQRLIGRELIPDDAMAVIELVKNAYDSGARSLEIILQPQTKKEPGYIEFRDDGQGMNIDDLRRLFMVAGYSERPEQVNSKSRVPTGEKGIGRFASDKLGRNLEVQTKVRQKEEGIRLNIDWNAFATKKKKFHEIVAPYQISRIPRISKEASGTILTITDLRSDWPPDKIEKIRAALSDLIDPFYEPMDFEINLQVRGSDKYSGKIAPTRPGSTDIEIQFNIEKNGSSVRRLSGTQFKRSRSATEIASTASTRALPQLTGRFFYSTEKPKKEFTKGLLPGVRLYRDGFRVEPFGSRTADWLGIAEKRAKRAGHAHIVPTRLFGFVEISRRAQKGLVDTTSRQALLDTEAAGALVTFLKEQVAFLEELIKTEVAEPRWKESTRRKAAQFEHARLHTLSIMSVGLAHELRQPLQVIRTEAGNIKTRLTMLDIKDKHIEGSQGSIDTSIDRIDKRINLIAELSKGNYETIESFDLAEQVRDECDLFKSTIGPMEIQLKLNLPKRQSVTFNRSATSSLLLNLLENAISAIRELHGSRKGIIGVTLSMKGTSHVLEVTDNGVGIPKEIRNKIFKQFASKKTGGMGVGLAICHTLITSLGGVIDFTTRENVGSSFVVKFPDSQR